LHAVRFWSGPAHTGHMRRPDHLADQLAWRCSQEEATEHLVLFNSRGDNRTSASASQQNIIRQAAGVRQAFKQHKKKHLPAWPHALAKTKGGRQTAFSLHPLLRSQSPKGSSDSSAHKMHVLSCGAETEGGLLWGLASLSALTTPLLFLSSHTGESTACIAGCLREKRQHNSHILGVRHAKARATTR
jgi:hypothetical protein